jgi:alkylhydroperoxidase/carboxymuconolactone decarboxylase family protein YurZ
MDPRLAQALEEVAQGVIAALRGIASSKFGVDDGVTVMALAVLTALRKCEFRTDAEVEDSLAVVIGFLDNLFSKVVSSMCADERKTLIGAILGRMQQLARQQSSGPSRLEDALEMIKSTLVNVMAAHAQGRIGTDEAVKLMSVAVVAALRKCEITTPQQLEAHVQAFS